MELPTTTWKGDESQ